MVEMVIVNLISCLRCFNKKCSIYRCMGIMLLYTLFVSAVRRGVLLLLDMSSQDVLFVFGILYIIPFYLLCREKLSRIIVVICLCCNYTAAIYILSRQIAGMISTGDFYFKLLMVQTILIAITILPFHEKMVDKFIYILQHVSKMRTGWGDYLSATAVVNFLTLLLIYLSYRGMEATWPKTLSIIFLMVTMYLLYSILYEVLMREQQIDALGKGIRLDELTGLHNRRSMLEDLEKLIHTRETFTLLFMDLDRFKLINDQYGHVVGDAYLKHFASMTQHIFHNHGRLYRFGGDEFVLICKGVISQQVVEQMREREWWSKNGPCPFLGVSVGVKVCRPPHPSLEEIITLADREMYRKKQSSAQSKRQ